MIVIIGGYAQGKREYARQHYANADERMFLLNSWVREKFENNENAVEELKNYIEKNPDTIFITEEVGNGIVPAERSDREFRDYIGAVQIELADTADEVIRVFCGIGQRLK